MLVSETVMLHKVLSKYLAVPAVEVRFPIVTRDVTDLGCPFLLWLISFRSFLRMMVHIVGHVAGAGRDQPPALGRV